jgi:hypothetical protein
LFYCFNFQRQLLKFSGCKRVLKHVWNSHPLASRKLNAVLLIPNERSERLKVIPTQSCP